MACRPNSRLVQRSKPHKHRPHPFGPRGKIAAVSVNRELRHLPYRVATALEPLLTEGVARFTSSRARYVAVGLGALALGAAAALVLFTDPDPVGRVFAVVGLAFFVPAGLFVVVQTARGRGAEVVVDDHGVSVRWDLWPGSTTYRIPWSAVHDVYVASMTIRPGQRALPVVELVAEQPLEAFLVSSTAGPSVRSLLRKDVRRWYLRFDGSRPSGHLLALPHVRFLTHQQLVETVQAAKALTTNNKGEH